MSAASCPWGHAEVSKTGDETSKVSSGWTWYTANLGHEQLHEAKSPARLRGRCSENLMNGRGLALVGLARSGIIMVAYKEQSAMVALLPVRSAIGFNVSRKLPPQQSTISANNRGALQVFLFPSPSGT